MALSLALLAGGLPHLDVYASWPTGGSTHKFVLFSEQAFGSAATTTLDEVAHLSASADLFTGYCVSVHAHVCVWVWVLTVWRATTTTPPRWVAVAVVGLVSTTLLTAVVFIFIADGFSAEGAAYHHTHANLDHTIRESYTVFGYLGIGAYCLWVLPAAVVWSLYTHDHQRRRAKLAIDPTYRTQ